MKIYIRALKNVDNVNSWSYATNFNYYAGHPTDLYFQVVNKDRGDYFRYMPVSGSSASVTFPNLDNAKRITITATQPFAQDPSIWKVSIASNQNVSSGNVMFNLIENSIAKSYMIDNFVTANSLNVGSC